jgi:hypothetical protein
VIVTFERPIAEDIVANKKAGLAPGFDLTLTLTQCSVDGRRSFSSATMMKLLPGAQRGASRLTRAHP